MPLFTFRCDNGHETDKLRSRDATTSDCPEGGAVARKLEVYRLRHILQGAGIIPATEPEYQHEFDMKDMHRRGWSFDRAVEGIRKNMVEGEDGVKRLSMAGMENA